MRQDRQSFGMKVGKNLNNHYFRRMYQIKTTSFDKLYDILETRLKEILFLRGGGRGNTNKKEKTNEKEK